MTIVNGAITDTSGNMINLVVTSGANNYFGTASVAQTNAGTYFTSNNTVNAINVGASALGGGNNAANMILSGSNNVRNGVTIGTATNIVGLQNNTLIVTGANGVAILPCLLLVVFCIVFFLQKRSQATAHSASNASH